MSLRNGRMLASHAEGRRLGDRQRRELGVGRSEERDDAAVGVPDEVIARLQQLEQLAGLNLEVDALERRVRRIAGARGHDERVALGERTLRRPSSCRPEPWTEHEPRAGPTRPRLCTYVA